MIKLSLRTADLRKTDLINELTATPASVLADAHIDVNRVQVTINGAIVARGSVNSTFADLGYPADSEITLSAIVKSDGAMQLVTHTPEKTTLVVSSIKKETYDLLAKGNPDALTITKETATGDKDLIFAIKYDPSIPFSYIGKFGVTFNAVDKDGNLVAVLATPTGKEDELKQKIAELVLPAQSNLLSLEMTVASSAAELTAAQDAIKASILIG